MSNSATMTGSELPRPKIHRLPKARVHLWAKRRLLVLVVPFCLGAALIAYASLHYAAPPQQMELAGRGEFLPAAEMPGADKTIVIRGNNSVIVGQMAKIPAENEQITEIKPLSDIDKDRGHELLSIISKY